jgi:hypothetical protein
MLCGKQNKFTIFDKVFYDFIVSDRKFFLC